MPKQIAFTKSALTALQPPAEGRDVYHDTAVHGLQLRVTSAGTKTFSVFRRVRGGLPERVTLGKFPKLTVEAARKLAAKTNMAIESGANPAEVKRAHKAEVTFGELFADYLELKSKPNKRTWKEDSAKYALHLKTPLGAKKLSKVTKGDLSAIHSALTKAGHGTTANRILSLVSSVYSWAKASGRWHENPATGTPRNKEHSRERFLQSHEIPRFFKALAAEPNDTIRDYFLMSLLTGARRANVLAMRWNEIDIDRAEWRIPRTKNDDSQHVPLTPEAVSILGQRRGRYDSPYVFPGDGKLGHLVEPKLGWKRILDRDELSNLTEAIQKSGKRFGQEPEESTGMALLRARAEAKRRKLDTSTVRMADLRIHDLRRTLGSWQARTGASLAIIGKSLNHKSVQTTAIYARLDTDPVRASVERATSAMMVAAGMKEASEVTPLKKKRKRS